MAAPVYKTKGDLRSDLLKALGYGGLGSSAGNFVPYADLLLEKAQNHVYLKLPDDKREREWLFNTGLNQRWYDIPADCDPDRIKGIWAFYQDEWIPLRRGIEPYHDARRDEINQHPMRWDLQANPTTTNNLQPNADFALADTTATGGVAGWSWDSSAWQITGGVAENLTVGSMVSDAAVTLSEYYDIAYSIADQAVDSVGFDSNYEDILGNTLGTSVGSHSHRVLAPNGAEGLRFMVTTTTGAKVDDVSVTRVNEQDVRAQLEFWPDAEDEVYPIKIEGFIQLMPFVEDGDRATVPDDLILLHAEAYGKKHLKKSDADAVMAMFNEQMKLIRGQQHNGKRYRRGHVEKDPPPRPRVVA